MSSYSFSPQFYQRWTCAPDPIRASIIQELTDITTLLQHDTPFETFVFSTHDLDAHLDNLYENHEAEQAIAKAIADKKAQEQAAAEKQRLEEERLEKEKQAKAADTKVKAADTKVKEEAKLKEAEAAQKEQQHNEQLANNKSASIDYNDISKNVTSKNDTSEVEKSVTDSRVENHQRIETLDAKSDATKTDADKRSIHEPANAVNNNNMKTVIDKAVADAGIHLSLKDAKLGATPPELIRELEIQIDDYLSEQMMLMSENLKSWLRAEVTQHLSEDKVGTNKDSKKS